MCHSAIDSWRLYVAETLIERRVVGWVILISTDTMSQIYFERGMNETALFSHFVKKNLAEWIFH